MATEIGTTLRETRIRRRVDLAEVEAATKIRVRYLRALENEEWDVLPGGAYTRSFIRTYANYLGLDGERLADEFRRTVGDPVGERYPRAEPAPAPPRRAPAASGGGPRLHVSRGALAALISIGLIVLLIGIGLAGDGDGGSEGEDSPSIGGRQGGGKPDGAAGGRTEPRRVSVRLTALAEVWVCLLDAKGTELVDGQILPAGAEEGPFRSGRFTVSFGNGEVEMEVNGAQAEIEDTPNPVGYVISRGGRLQPLSEAERPTCT
jgi:cytoskeleton protein RodZ